MGLANGKKRSNGALFRLSPAPLGFCWRLRNKAFFPLWKIMEMELVKGGMELHSTFCQPYSGLFFPFWK
jgi:hypothetical protein